MKFWIHFSQIPAMAILFTLYYLVLAHLTGKIKENLNQGNYGCCFFVNLRKAFDTVDHDILSGKLKYYSIGGVSYNQFDSCQKERKQYVSINGYDSDKYLLISYRVLQGFVLDSLLFFKSNDFNTVVKRCKVHSFVDNTSLSHIRN